MQQQYTMNSEDKMIMRILEVTFINILGCIEKQQEKATDEEFDTHNKLHFLSRLRNSTIATKISQSEEFEKFDKYSLKNCIEKALMLESRLQIREMVTIARENLENKDPKVMEMSEEGEEQQEELNILSEDKGPGRFRNPNLANLICYKCGGYGHYGRECPEANQAMEQLEDRIVGRIETFLQCLHTSNFTIHE